MPDPVRIQKVTEVPVLDVRLGDRQRPLSGAAVEALMASIQAEGLQNPIVVRRVPAKDGFAAFHALISGAHRLEAARRLGWKTIPAAAYECSVRQARAMEIDENLVRRELAPLDLAVALSERKELHEYLHPETRAGVAGATAKHGAADIMSVASFAAIAAENLGASERHVRRLVAAGNAVRAEGVAKFRGLDPAPSVSDLLAFAALEPDQRMKVGHFLEAGVATSIPAAIALLSGDEPKAEPGPVARFSSIWARYTRSERFAIVATHHVELRQMLDEYEAEQARLDGAE
jgi:ParB family chromosome partitioning protein